MTRTANYRSAVNLLNVAGKLLSLEPRLAMHAIQNRCEQFLARDVIYTSRAYATMSVSVCL